MKILANELRVGNFVGLKKSEWDSFSNWFEEMTHDEIKNFLEDSNKYAIVQAISKEVELTAYGCDIDYYDLTEIKPIPLTEEWLVKFGFDIDTDKGWNRSEDINYDVYSLNNFDVALIDVVYKLWIEIEGDTWYNSSLTAIKYVHQLQNLYFALTSEELTLKP